MVRKTINEQSRFNGLAFPFLAQNGEEPTIKAILNPNDLKINSVLIFIETYTQLTGGTSFVELDGWYTQSLQDHHKLVTDQHPSLSSQWEWSTPNIARDYIISTWWGAETNWKYFSLWGRNQSSGNSDNTMEPKQKNKNNV